MGLPLKQLPPLFLIDSHHAHCSSIVAFPDGELFVVYYHAIKEANRQQAIYGVRKLPNQDSWSAPFLVSKDSPRWMEGNPSICDCPRYGKTLAFLCDELWRMVGV